MRVSASGKFFSLGGSPFLFRGVEYARPYGPTPGGDLTGMIRDLARMRAAGFTVVSVPYLPPPAVEAAAESGLHFLIEHDDQTWARVAGESRRERRRLVRVLVTRLRRAVNEWKGSEALVGVNLGSRHSWPHWSGSDRRFVRRVANELAIAAREEDEALLVGWRDGWPSHAGCPEEADFLTVDLALSSSDDLARALTACHGQVGDRPLVLGGVALAGAASERPNLDYAWLMNTAIERGVGGTVARDPVRADSEAARINGRTVRDLDIDWPSLTVVINAYNAGATLEECLSHCEVLDYPSLEVVVVDDGSTDGTRAIADAHSGVRLVTMPHAGLAAGRNVGFRAATGDLVVYLDADAYPSPEWPWYIALAALGEGAGGSGGPNVPPPDDPIPARIVAQSPGGPVPQVRDGVRAQHLPGCNMAFWRDVLDELQGFDPVIEGAEDLELEWRLLQSGRSLGYHPAALAWHHRRGGILPYLRQQGHYGRGQAMLERRYPERFPARFRLKKAIDVLRRRIRRSGSPASYPVMYLSLPGPARPLLDLAHQWGMPIAAVLACTAPLGLAQRRLAAPAAAAAAYVGALFTIDALLAGAGRRRPDRTFRFRTGAAAFRLLRPLAFRWGHMSGSRELRRIPPDWPPTPAELQATRGADRTVMTRSTARPG